MSGKERPSSGADGPAPPEARGAGSRPAPLAYDRVALAANAAGRLTPDQASALTAKARLDTGVRLLPVLVAILVASDALLALATGHGTGIVCYSGCYDGGSSPPQLTLLLSTAVAGAFAWLAARVWLSVRSDVRARGVDLITGRIGRRSRVIHSGTGRPLGTLYYLDVAGRTFRVGKAVFDAAPATGAVTLFVAPRSRRVVNFELLDEDLASAQS